MFTLDRYCAVSIIMGIYKSWSDRSQQLDCPEDWTTCAVRSRPYMLEIHSLGKCNYGAGIGGDIKTARAITTGTRTVSLALRVIRALRMLLKARRVGSQLSRAVRTAVGSKDSRRYTKLGFDLDLVYITPRMICMAAPGVNQLLTRAVDGDIVGLNNSMMVARFFATRHYDDFRAFNLCAEEIGDYAMQRLFGQVMRVPIKDRQTPLLTEVLTFCENAAHYLFLDDANMLVLHCNSGRDRSGVFASAFLLYSGHSSSATDAIDFFATRRSSTRKADLEQQQAVRGASLTRMLHYVSAVVDGTNSLSPVERVLCGIERKGLSKASGRSIQISCGAILLLDS